MHSQFHALKYNNICIEIVEKTFPLAVNGVSGFQLVIDNSVNFFVFRLVRRVGPRSDY